MTGKQRKYVISKCDNAEGSINHHAEHVVSAVTRLGLSKSY